MNEDFDIDDRRLCPDGSCIGLIGEDGRCKVCGRADDGSVQARPAIATSCFPVDPADPVDAAAEGEEAFDDDRELCPDGACIGVIGSDGKCKVCGTPRGS